MARHKSKNPDSTALDLRHAIPAAVVLLFSLPVSAGELFNNGNAVARWDNVLAYSATFRTEPRNAALLTNINSDDADRNFTSGIVSNRFDLLSQFDFSASGFGIEASAAAWY